MHRVMKREKVEGRGPVLQCIAVMRKIPDDAKTSISWWGMWKGTLQHVPAIREGYTGAVTSPSRVLQNATLHHC